MLWTTALPTVVATALVFWLPGAAVLGALGLRGLRLAALAPATGAGLLAVGASVAGPLGVPWVPWTAAALTVLAASLTAAAHRLSRHGVAAAPSGGSAPSRPLDRRGRRWLVAVVIGSVAAQLVPVAIGMGRPDRVQNAWDALFHLRAVVEAREAARIDPFWAGRLVDPSGGTLVYPSGWHALAMLVPAADPRVTVTICAIVPCVVAYALGVALLAREVSGSRLATILAPLMTAAGVAGPLPIALQPGLIPNAFALALVPAVVSVAVRTWRVQAARSVSNRPSRMGDVVAAGAGLLGITLVHPGAAAGAVVLASPWVAVVGVRAARTGWRQGRHAPVGLTVVVASMAVVGALAALSVSTAPLVVGAADNGPPVPLAVVLRRIVTGDLAEYPVYPILPMIFALGCCWVAWRRRARGTSDHLLMLAAALVVVVYVAAASGGAAGSAVTIVWYSEARRIAPLVGVCLSVLSASGLALGAHLAAGRVTLPQGWSHARAAAVLTVGVIALALVPGLSAAYRLADDTFSQDVPARPRPDDRLPYLTVDEEHLIDRLANTLDPSELLLGSSLAGPGHLAALTGQRVVQTYHTEQLERSSIYVSTYLGRLADDPRVCEAVRTLDARYVWVDPYPLHPRYSRFAPSDDFTRYPTELAPIDSAGTTAVYDLSGCYDDAAAPKP